jgi:hypothetical protein
MMRMRMLTDLSQPGDDSASHSSTTDRYQYIGRALALLTPKARVDGCMDELHRDYLDQALVRSDQLGPDVFVNGKV